MNNKEIVIKETELKQLVYIYNCSNSTIQIHGKINAISIDGCKKCGIVLDSTVSSVDIVNSKSCQIQITGKVPTAQVDKTDGLMLFVSPASKDIEILTAKSSEINISINNGDDYIEHAVPEQLRTVIVGGKLLTNVVEHKG